MESYLLKRTNKHNTKQNEQSQHLNHVCLPLHVCTMLVNIHHLPLCLFWKHAKGPSTRRRNPDNK